jgi:hypothetical protein
MTDESEVGETTPLVPRASSGSYSSDGGKGYEIGVLPIAASNASAVNGKGPDTPVPDKPAAIMFGARIQTKPNKKDKKGKKMKGIKMTKTGASMAERQVQMNLIKHNLAAECFLCRQF